MFSIGSYHIKKLSHHFNIWIQTTHLKINLFPPGDGVKQIKGNGLGELSEYYEEWKKRVVVVIVCEKRETIKKKIDILMKYSVK